MGDRKRTYDRKNDAVKVAALARYDLLGKVRETAREFNIPPATLSTWIKERKVGELAVCNLEDRIEQTKKVMIQETKNVMDKALKVIDRKINDCNAYQAATIYGILFDKIQKMEGAEGAGDGTTINNTYIMQMPEQEQYGLMAKVAERMKNRDVIEAVAEVLSEDNNSGDIPEWEE